MELAEHLFRRESGRITAVLARLFGLRNLPLIEDAVQDAFCKALEVWALRGLPENPSAWLHTTAKNRVLDQLRRHRTARASEPALSQFLESISQRSDSLHPMLNPDAIPDDQLRMMFSCCHPRLPEEAQVMLVLHILCGFSVPEVAAAFLTTQTAVEKRIPRAKKILASSQTLFDTQAPTAFSSRLPAVQRALYLLFSEGYHGSSTTSPVRAELCQEAMQLAALLLESPLGATPTSFALSALMCLHRARLPARLTPTGQIHPLWSQDRSLWDSRLIAEGLHLLELSASGAALSEFHLEAAIAAIHATSPSLAATDWATIVSLYDSLTALRPSPIVALNRAIALGQRDGPESALLALSAIADSPRLAAYPFFHAAWGELELQRGCPDAARKHLATALGLSRSPMEREFFLQRLQACGDAEAPHAV